MTDAWFDEYLYQIVVPKDMLSPELRAVVDTDKVSILLKEVRQERSRADRRDELLVYKDLEPCTL